MLEYSEGVVFARPPAGRTRLGFGAFLLVAFALSWAGAAPMVAATWIDPAEQPELVAKIAALQPLQLLMIFGTLIAALIATLVNYGLRGLGSLLKAVFRWRVSPLWYLVVLGGPLAISIAASMIARQYDPSLAPFSLDASMFAAAGQIFLVYLIANTEEIAWRGYALPQLQARLAPLTASVLLAVIWGVFHSPYFFMKGGHPAGYSIALFAGMIIAIGLIAGAVFNATRGSVLIAHFMHQALNASGESMQIFPAMNHGSPWPFRLFVALLAAGGLLAALWLATRRRPDTV